MLLAFELSMPTVGSWNGSWSDKPSKFVKVRNIGKTKEAKALGKLLDKRSFQYDFQDGWGAQVRVSIVDSTEAQQLRRMSAGFYGYDWMIDSILECNEIRTPERGK